MKKPLTYISLFSSAGVGCYGFKLNGFECIATNELLTKRLKIQAFNNVFSFFEVIVQVPLANTHFFCNCSECNL